MNFYNPYMYSMPSMGAASSPGILKTLLGGAGRFNWSSILTNTQKTIGVVNQAIPMVKGVAPTFRNAKTMFKVMNEFKKPDNKNKIVNKETVTNKINEVKNNIVSKEDSTKKSFVPINGPQFFI
jgi:hypothetical protein